MKKLIIMASGIVLKEYLPYQLNLCTGTNPKKFPEIPAEIYSRCRFSQARAKYSEQVKTKG